MIRMNEENTRAGTLFVWRIEDLLQRSTLPPETVLNIMRTAHANSDSVLLEIKRLQHEQRTIK